MSAEARSMERLAERLLGPGGAPSWGIVLGSGFNGWAGRIEEPRDVPFAEVEGMPEPLTAGHAGRFVGGRVGAARVVAAAGRIHLHEGRSPKETVRAVEVLAGLGVHSILLTTAVGGVAPHLEAGAALCVSDQINLTGADPTAGKGSFTDASGLYDPEYRRFLGAAGLPEAILAGVRGPSYETPAEVRALWSMGAEAVCMSTVLEALEARSLGMRTAAVAVVGNRAGTPGIDHGEVVRLVSVAAAALWPRIKALITSAA